MASNRTVYNVVLDASGDKWLVTQEGSDSMREVFARKAEAVLTAKVRAKKQGPSQVKVHKADGNMEYESTYGEDRRVARVSAVTSRLVRSKRGRCESTPYAARH